MRGGDDEELRSSEERLKQDIADWKHGEGYAGEIPGLRSFANAANAIACGEGGREYAEGSSDVEGRFSQRLG